MILFIKVMWVKLDNKCLAEIIRRIPEYSPKYNKFKYLFIKNKSVLVLSEH